MTRQLLS